jgi:hypothetical protein
MINISYSCADLPTFKEIASFTKTYPPQLPMQLPLFILHMQIKGKDPGLEGQIINDITMDTGYNRF